jgi:hypothetical protein
MRLDTITILDANDPDADNNLNNMTDLLDNTMNNTVAF